MPKKPATWKKFFDHLKQSEKFQSCVPLGISKQLYYDEIVDQIKFEIADWYGVSKKHSMLSYAKPEDIIVDYIFCTAEEAHYFLPLFLEENDYVGDDADGS